MSEVTVVSKKPRKRYNVSAKTLVEHYMAVHKSGGTIADVANRVGMPVDLTRNRVWQLNKKLLEAKDKTLPDLARQSNSKSKVDVDELVKMLG